MFGILDGEKKIINFVGFLKIICLVHEVIRLKKRGIGYHHKSSGKRSFPEEDTGNGVCQGEGSHGGQECPAAGSH
jgi:hypothetical protein